MREFIAPSAAFVVMEKKKKKGSTAKKAGLVSQVLGVADKSFRRRWVCVCACELSCPGFVPFLPPSLLHSPPLAFLSLSFTLISVSLDYCTSASPVPAGWGGPMGL